MADSSKLYSINLQESIEDFTWNQFKKDKGFLKSLFYRRNKHYMDIRWGYVQFDHKTISFEPRKAPRIIDTDETVPRELYYSEYENRTPFSQQYNFSTTRETTSTTSVELQESYTLGAETNLTINLGVVEIGGGVSGELSVSKTNGQEYSETMSWDINTDIKVKSGHKAKASLRVYEASKQYDFEVKTTISLPKGKLPVSVRRSADDKIQYVVWITNISKIFTEDFMNRNSIVSREVEDTAANKIRTVIDITSHGVCNTVAWKNQYVKVDSEQLPDCPVVPIADSSEDEQGKDGEE